MARSQENNQTQTQSLQDISTTEELVPSLLAKINALTKENELYRAKAPIVGVRWYGEGGHTIHLDAPLRGLDKVIFEGYGDKGIIDLGAWVRMRNTEEAKYGILVRDDSVIEELGFSGVVADRDRKGNPNAFTLQEALAVVKGKIIDIKEACSKCNHHFPVKHLLRVAKDNNVKDKTKLSVIYERFNELFTYHRFSLMHKHDLTTACELANIPWSSSSKEKDMIDALVALELKTVKAYEEY